MFALASTLKGEMTVGIYQAELTRAIHFAEPVEDQIARGYVRTLCRQTEKAQSLEAGVVDCLGCHKEAERRRLQLLEAE